MDNQEKSNEHTTLYMVQLASMIEHMPDATVLIDRVGNILMANQQLERMFLYDHMELIGESLDLLVPVRLRGRHESHRQSYFASPKRRAMGRQLDLFGLRKDGAEFSVDISLNPINTEHGPMVLAAVRDMTETIQLQEKEKILDKIISKAAMVTMSITDLTEATNNVTKVQAVQVSKIRRINRRLMFVIFTLFLLVLLSFYQLSRVQMNSTEIANVQEVGTIRGIETAREQQARRERVFCPILKALLDSYDPASDYAKTNPANYEEIFVSLEQGAAYLGCKIYTRTNQAKPEQRP